MASPTEKRGSRSLTSFTSEPLDRRADDDLPDNVKGLAVWKEYDDERGYYVYDKQADYYVAIEFDDAKRAWYFITWDKYINRWVTVKPVPYDYGLGPYRSNTTVGIDVDSD